MVFAKIPLTLIKTMPSFAASGLSESYIDRELPSLGIATVEDFLSLLETLPGAVLEESEADPEALQTLYEEALARLVPPVNRRLLEVVPSRLTPFGGAPEELSQRPLDDFDLREMDLREMSIAPPSPEGLPDAISLLDNCAQPMHDQGDRPTCTVFSAVAVLEYLLCRVRNTPIDLSEQYLYWLVAQTGALVEGRALLEDVFELARSTGVCQESLWSYEPTLLADDLTHGDPPDRNACDSDAIGHRFGTVSGLSNPRDVNAIRQMLAEGRPVAVEVPLFQSYVIPSLYYSGQIILPPQGAGVIDHHDLVLVGYQTQSADVPKDLFLVRNSVGQLWGRDSSIVLHHGTIPFDYIASYAEKAWSGSV